MSLVLRLVQIWIDVHLPIASTFCRQHRMVNNNNNNHWADRKLGRQRKETPPHPPNARAPGGTCYTKQPRNKSACMNKNSRVGRCRCRQTQTRKNNRIRRRGPLQCVPLLAVRLPLRSAILAVMISIVPQPVDPEEVAIRVVVWTTAGLRGAAAAAAMSPHPPRH